MAEPARASPIAVQRQGWERGLAMAVCTVGVATVLGYFVLGERLTDVVMVYLLGVVLVAMRYGYVPSLLAGGLSIAALDFFFIPPYFSFEIADMRYALTFAIMLLVGFVISNLTERIRRTAVAAGERETRTATLYAMSRELSVASSVTEIADVAVRHVRGTYDCSVSVLLLDEHGGLRKANGDADPSSGPDASVLRRASELVTRPMVAPPPAGYVLATGERLLPLRTAAGVSGLLALGPVAASRLAADDSLPLLEAFSNQIALAVERGALSEETQRTQVEMQKERLRNALLSSVSHDLRTPLSVIKGAATALLEQEGALPPARQHEYLESISDEAVRLNDLVRNLLNMTSLEAGALRAHKEWQLLEEVVGVALHRLRDELRGRVVSVHIDPEASLVPLDAVLLAQVLANLIENAAKYTPQGSPIEIVARPDEGGVEVSVDDHGPGVPAGEEGAIFEKFHRAPADARVGGMGLGLTICRGIVAVHGGRIWCENRPDGGASFRFVLPREGAPPRQDTGELTTTVVK